MLASLLPPDPVPSCTSRSSQHQSRSMHPLDGLVLHLLPGRIPGLTQQELLPRLQRALPCSPALAMTEVRPPVLSSVLARLRRQKQIEAAGDGPRRCYWRLVPDPLTGSQTATLLDAEGDDQLSADPLAWHAAEPLSEPVDSAASSLLHPSDEQHARRGRPGGRKR